MGREGSCLFKKSCCVSVTIIHCEISNKFILKHVNEVETCVNTMCTYLYVAVSIHTSVFACVYIYVHINLFLYCTRPGFWFLTRGTSTIVRPKQAECEFTFRLLIICCWLYSISNAPASLYTFMLVRCLQLSRRLCCVQHTSLQVWTQKLSFFLLFLFCLKLVVWLFYLHVAVSLKQ